MDVLVSNGPIALDATLWDEPTTGIGLYTHQLARGLMALGVEVRRMGARRSGEAPRGAHGRTRYILADLPRQLAGVPLFHAVGNFNLPLLRPAGTRFVLTVHDLIPLTHPGTVSRAFRWQFRLWLTRSLQVADHVVCVSEHTRRELLARFPDVGPRASVVHNGCDHLDAAPTATPLERVYVDSLALPERFVLYAGSLDLRKNVALVLDALERLGTGTTLVLVGQGWFGSGPVERRIGQMRARGFDVRPLGYQPQGVYAEVMRRASAFVFPSRAEGFGLPPLEAMRAGVPVVASTAGALPEVCGEAAALVDPDDAEGLAAELVRLLGSTQERQRRAALGRQQAAHFTWARAAREVLEVYRTLLERP
jgi:glycosyltransferase involved in cell wall biosynthesis